MNFIVPVDHSVKMKENEKIDKYVDLARKCVTYLYAVACRNIFNTIKTSGHSSFKKYTSHFYLKGLERVTKGIIVWEVSWRLNRTTTYWPLPNSSGYSSVSFPFSWAAQPGAWGPSLSWNMVLIPTSSLQLIWTSWRPLTSCECHIYTQFNPSTVNVIPWSPDIFDQMHWLFTQVHFFFWQLGWGQYVTNEDNGGT